MYTRAQRQARLSSKWFIWFYKVHMNSLVILSWNVVLPYTPIPSLETSCTNFFTSPALITALTGDNGHGSSEEPQGTHSPCWHSSGCQLLWGPGSGASSKHTLPGPAQSSSRSCLGSKGEPCSPCTWNTVPDTSAVKIPAPTFTSSLRLSLHPLPLHRHPLWVKSW